MNAIRDIEYPNGEWRNKDGRPDSMWQVVQWRQENYKGTPKECIAATGLSKNTVYKWWKEIDKIGGE